MIILGLTGSIGMGKTTTAGMFLAGHMRRDPLNLKVLESFIHPMVGDMRAAFFEQAKQNKADIAVLDVPLLFETGGDRHVDKIAVVTAPASVQRERVMARSGMTEELFTMILSRQMADSEKRARADYLIFSDQGLPFAREQVQKIIEDLRSQKV